MTAPGSSPPAQRGPLRSLHHGRPCSPNATFWAQLSSLVYTAIEPSGGKQGCQQAKADLTHFLPKRHVFFVVVVCLFFNLKV